MSTSRIQKQPFVAWTDPNEWASTNVFRKTCEKHIRETLNKLEPIVQTDGIDGIIVFDKLAHGLAATSLAFQGKGTFPQSDHGNPCERHFEEQALCDEINAHHALACVHEGAKGMLLTNAHNPGQRILLLDLKEVAHLHPQAGTDTEKKAAITGLIAHELAHANEYKNNTPARPKHQDIDDNTQDSENTLVTTDMMVGEHIATTVECHAQVALFGGVSKDLTDRIAKMANNTPQTHTIQDNTHPQDKKHILEQVGYHIGTLAAYATANAPILGEKDHTTSKEVARRLQNSPWKQAVQSCQKLLEDTTNRQSSEVKRNLAQVTAKILDTPDMLKTKNIRQNIRPNAERQP